MNVYFYDVAYGVVVGTNGTILKTLWQGWLWNPQTSGTTYDLSDISFAGPSNGWAVGNNGTILHPNVEYVYVNSDMDSCVYDLNNNLIEDYSFGWNGSTWIGGNHRYFYIYENNKLVEKDQQNWDEYSQVWITNWKWSYTYDENNNLEEEIYLYWNWHVPQWENQDRWVFTYDINNNRIEQVHQIGDISLWINSDKTTYAYDNDNKLITEVGQNWSSTTWVNDYKYLYSYDIDDNRTQSIRQNWNGSAWTYYNRDLYSYIPAALIQGQGYEITGNVTDNSSNPLEDAIVTLTGQYNTSKTDTTDVSGNYNFNDVLSGNYNISASFPGYYTSGKNVFVEGSDTGWVNQLSGTTDDLLCIDFVNSNNGWACGWNGTVLKTTDGGINWSYLTDLDILYSICFPDTNNGWACGWGGKIWRTTNGGVDWVSQTSGTSVNLGNIFFFDVNNGWAVGDNGKILRTTNGGAVWSLQASGTTNGIYDICFTDVNRGWACGWYGTILRTTDGGANWISQTSGTSNNLKSISFTDANNGCAVGLGGTILRTTNGGTTWASQSSGITLELRDVFLSDVNNGAAVGQGGTILRTTNGGSAWTPQSSGTTTWLSSVYFTNTNSGTIVGDAGTILHTSSSSTCTVNFTLYPVTAGSFQLSDSLTLYAENITPDPSIPYTYLASGNVNINGILFFNCDVLLVHVPILEKNIISGVGTLSAVSGQNYKIAENVPFSFEAQDEGKLVPIALEYLIQGFENLYGFNLKIGTLDFDMRATDTLITADCLFWNLSSPLQEALDAFMEKDTTALSKIPYPTDLAFGRTYSIHHGKDWHLNFTLGNLGKLANFKAFKIEELSLNYDGYTESLGGSLAIEIPGDKDDDTTHTKVKSLKELPGNLKNIPVEVVNEKKEKLYSTNFINILESPKGSKTSFKLKLTIQFSEGKIDSFSICLTPPEPIPIFSTGLDITTLCGGVGGLAAPGWNLGVYVDIASKLKVGGIPVVGFDDFGVNIRPWTYFQGGGTFKVFDTDVANGFLSYDAIKKTLELNGNLDFFDIIIGNIYASLNADGFIGSASATLKTPTITQPGWLKFASNKTLASAQVDVNNTTMRAQTRLKIGRVCLPWIGCKNIYANLAMKIKFDIPFHFYVGTNYNNLIQLWKGRKDDENIHLFQVGPNTSQLTVVAGNDMNLFDFYLMHLPDSTVYNSTNSAYAQYAETYQTVMVVDKPQSGNWEFHTSQAEPITLDYFGINQQPIVLLKEPGQRGTRSNDVNLKFNDYTDTLQVKVYYDTDNKNFDGVFIQEFTVLNNANLDFTWLNDDLPNGEYFIYCQIDDGQNAPVMQYAPGSINVQNSIFTETPQNFTVVQEEDSTVKASWTGSSASSVTIVYYKNITTGKIAQTAVADSNYVYLRNLKFGQEYRFWAAYVDPDNQNPGPKSGEDNLIFTNNIENNPPYFKLNPDSSWVFIQDEAGNFNLIAGDADGDPVTFGVSQNPPGMTVNGSEINWMPTYDDRGVYNILLTASDGPQSIDSIYKEVIVYTQDQMDTLIDFNSLNLYEQNNMFITLENYKSPNQVESVTLKNKRTNQETTVACRRVDDFKFIGEFDLSYAKKSVITVSDRDTLLAIYDDKITYAFYDSTPQDNDTTAPAQINDLQIIGMGANQVKLKWTATGDDGNIGTAFKYDIRYAYSPILSEGDYLIANMYPTYFYPAPSGQPDSLILNLKNLAGSASHDTVYFSIRAADDMLKWSDLGNCAYINYLISPDSVIASVFNVYKMNIDWSEIGEKAWHIAEKGDVKISKLKTRQSLNDNLIDKKETTKKSGFTEKASGKTGNFKADGSSGDKSSGKKITSKNDMEMGGRGDITIDHYKVYRKIDNNSYIMIANNVSSSAFTDNLFSSPDGVYKYGIKAVYSSGEESEMATSNNVTMNRFTNLRILCTIQDTTSFGNINLFMEGQDTVYHQIYSRTTNSTGLILIDNVYQTQYRLELSKPGNNTIVDTISVSDTSNEFSYTLVPFISCNIQAVLEGLYDVGTNTLNMTDNFKVYLRNTFYPYTVIDSSVSTIPTQPFVFTGLFGFPNAPNGNYYLVVKHRNGIETWSKAGGVQLTKGVVANYNFTTSSSQAYGNNLVLKGTKWCIYSGDVNEDGIIDAQDLAAVDNDIYNSVTGYVPTDVNGDGVVNADDMAIIYNNSYNFISVKKPSDVIITKPKEKAIKKGSQ